MPAARGAGARHAERLLEKRRGFFRIGNDDGDVAKPGSHEPSPLLVFGIRA